MLNLYTHLLPGVTASNLVWVSIPTNYGQLSTNVENSLTTAGNTLPIATNVVTTLMIAYELWYVVVNGIRWICHEIILQETP